MSGSRVDGCAHRAPARYGLRQAGGEAEADIHSWRAAGADRAQNLYGELTKAAGRGGHMSMLPPHSLDFEWLTRIKSCDKTPSSAHRCSSLSVDVRNLHIRQPCIFHKEIGLSKTMLLAQTRKSYIDAEAIAVKYAVARTR